MFICLATAPGPPDPVGKGGPCLQSIADTSSDCADVIVNTFDGFNACSTHRESTRGAIDPNEKVVIAKRFIQPDQLLVYSIHFENIGTIEARDVFVTDILDSNLDISTLNVITPGVSFDQAARTLRWDLLNRNLQPAETGNVLLSVRPR